MAARPTPMERVTLESTAPMGQGFGRHPRGGMQIFVKTFKIRCTLWTMMVLGGIPAKGNHKAPGKSLAGDDSGRPGKTLAGAAARPLPRTPAGPPSDQRQSRLHRRSHAAADPTSWAGTCMAACRSSWRPTAAPPQLPARLHGITGTAGQGACRHGRERRRTRQGSPPPPIKQGHLSKAIKCALSCNARDNLASLYPFHVLCATVAAPFPIKGGPRRPGRGFGFLELLTPHS